MKKRTTQPLRWTILVDLINSLISDKNYEDALLLALAGLTGYRKQNILDLKIKDVRNVDRIVVEREAKTAKFRRANLSPQAQEIISKCFSNIIFPPSQEYIFVSKKGKTSGQKLSGEGANIRLRKILEKYNIETEHDTFHFLRKSFARRMSDLIFAKTGNFIIAIHVASHLLNHKTIKQTMDYLGYTFEYATWAYQNILNSSYNDNLINSTFPTADIRFVPNGNHSDVHI